MNSSEPDTERRTDERGPVDPPAGEDLPRRPDETRVAAAPKGGDDEPREPAAPRVEAVVVAHEPGSWFDETMLALGAQDYPRLAVTVAASGDRARIAERARSAVPAVRIVDAPPDAGYATCVNAAVATSDPAPAFFLFCHDDVALGPDSVRLLVEEALRSNAGIVGPKLVSWERSDVLVEVGLDVDKLAHVAPRVDPGELDQEQHDGVRDVFAVSGATQLVRADLFRALQGFDDAMGVTGEDIDLCWRAHLAGARVMVVPSAVGRHRAGLADRHDADVVDTERERNRIRTILTGYGRFHSLRVVPQAVVYSLLRIVGALLSGHFGRARATAGAWWWNLRRPGSLLARRRALAGIRQVGDADLRGLQVNGFAPVSAFVRGQFGDGGGAMGARSRNLIRSIRTGPSRRSLGFWAGAAALFVFGSRHLLTRGVAEVGDLSAFDLGARELFGRFFDSWVHSGTGREGAAPTAYGLVAALATLLGGAMGLTRTVLTVGMIVIGAIGMWRFLRPFTSPWIRVVGTLVYLCSPVPYNALANGSWSALWLFGLLPWVLAGLARAARLSPFGRVGGPVGEGLLEPSWSREALGGGLVVGVLTAFVPFTVVVVVAMAVLIVIGSWLAGHPAGAARLAAVTAMTLAVAAVLHLPWLVDAARSGSGWDWLVGTRPEGSSALDVGQLLRLDSGPIGGGTIGWAILVAAATPLLLARGPRLAWAVRGLTLHLAAVAVLWADSRGWLPVPLPRPEAVLSVGALGLAVATAMGVAAIERDLRTYRLGWRQLLPVLSVVAIAAVVVPIVVASFDGAWRMPTEDYNRQFAAEAEVASGRVLWIGHDDVLGAAGRSFGDGLTLAITAGLEVGLEDRWAGVAAPADPLVADAIELALDGGTSRLGRLLAPFSIAEVIVVEQSAPAPQNGLVEGLPPAIDNALGEQLDLADLESSSGLRRYRNTSWLPFAAVVPSGTTAGTSLHDWAAAGAGPGVVPGALATGPGAGRVETTMTGPATVGDEVYLAVPAATSWRMVVDGRPASRGPALDWAIAFTPTTDGSATLEHRTSAAHRAMMAGQMIMWLVALVALARINTRAVEARP